MNVALSRYFSAPPAGLTAEIKLSEPLARYTFYRIGGPASVLAVPRTREDLEWIWRGIRETGARFFILGAGSNLLVSDEGFDGVVLRVGKLSPEISGSEASGRALTAGGSVMISALLRRAAQEGWGGLEFLTGIPGSVGGAVRMNAGTHLGETESRLRRVDALVLGGAEGDVGDGSGGAIEERSFSGSELRFQYRRNLFLPSGSIVWSTGWEIDREEPRVVKERIDRTLERRKQTQPIDYPSCGSVFKNPRGAPSAPGLSAWQVLDRLGLRGHRIGGAQISEKHSNFIVNLGGARASDVRGLIELAKSRARAELGVELQEEVIFVGP